MLIVVRSQIGTCSIIPDGTLPPRQYELDEASWAAAMA